MPEGARQRALPVNTGGKPGELFRRERPGDVPVTGPVEGSPVETAGAEPDAVAVPHCTAPILLDDEME